MLFRSVQRKNILPIWLPTLKRWVVFNIASHIGAMPERAWRMAEKKYRCFFGTPCQSDSQIHDRPPTFFYKRGTYHVGSDRGILHKERLSHLFVGNGWRLRHHCSRRSFKAQKGIPVHPSKMRYSVQRAGRPIPRSLQTAL